MRPTIKSAIDNVPPRDALLECENCGCLVVVLGLGPHQQLGLVRSCICATCRGDSPFTEIL